MFKQGNTRRFKANINLAGRLSVLKEKKEHLDYIFFLIEYYFW